MTDKITVEIDAELLAQLTLATLFYTTALTMEMDADGLSYDEWVVLRDRHNRYSAAYDEAEGLRQEAKGAARRNAAAAKGYAYFDGLYKSEGGAS